MSTIGRKNRWKQCTNEIINWLRRSSTPTYFHHRTHTHWIHGAKNSERHVIHWINFILFLNCHLCRHRNRWHIRDVGGMASHLGQAVGARSHGSNVIGGSRFHHHHILDRYDIAADWCRQSVPIDPDILQVQRSGRVLHLRVAHHILCRLHGRVGLLRKKEFAFAVRLQSIAIVCGYPRYGTNTYRTHFTHDSSWFTI